MGVLLAGIVAVNVAVLGLNMKVERLDGQKQKIEARSAEISSQLASAAAASRIEAAAHGRLGLVDATATTYVDAGRPRR